MGNYHINRTKHYIGVVKTTISNVYSRIFNKNNSIESINHSISKENEYKTKILKNNIEIKNKSFNNIENLENHNITLKSVIENYNEETAYEDNNNCVSIVIPVYNGYETLKDNLISVFDNTDIKHKIIIINDASTDERINTLLKNYINKDNCSIIENKENLGFVKSVNIAMSYVKTEIAILLNSDTVVPKKWVEKMVYPYYIFNSLATTTPFSNSSTIYSFPKPFQDNEMKFDLEDINEAVSLIKTNNNGLENTYSGSGFCMSINMKVWKEIGPLDEQAFEKGYGEENDWCFRATQKGYIHKVIPNLFVQHKHGGSFDSKERKSMVKNHQLILKERYPEIMNDVVPSFMKEDKWMIYRMLLSIIISNKKMMLIIDFDSSYKINHNIIDNYENQGYYVIIVTYKEKIGKYKLIANTVSEYNYALFDNFEELSWIFDKFNVQKWKINGNIGEEKNISAEIMLSRISKILPSNNY